MYVLDRIASWGFIVVGNDDPQSGTGETASETLEFILNIGADSELYGKIDKNNIGIMGYSQGGAGALCAVTNFDNGKLYKTIFTGSAAYPFLAHNMGWDYDVSKVVIPYFMTSGTGKTDDAGVPDITKDFAGVCPLEAVVTNYTISTATYSLTFAVPDLFLVCYANGWPSGPSRSHTHFAPIVLNLRKRLGSHLQELDYGIGER